MERAERLLQAPLQKCRKAVPPKKCREASTTKKCQKVAPPKKCRKEVCLKICSKCNPPQKCCEAALQKVPCYVYVASTKKVKATSPLDKCCKAAPLKKYHKAATTKCFAAALLEISLQAPLTLKPSLLAPCILVPEDACILYENNFLSSISLLIKHSSYTNS